MFVRAAMTKKLVIGVGLVLALGPGVRADGPADMIQLVPTDAWGFVVAKSLDNFDEKAKQLKEALGLPIPVPVTTMALEPLALGDTVDRKRPICAIVLDAQKFGGQNAAVLLVPATDTKALLEKLSAEEGEEGISKCTVMGEPAFAATREKVVIIGPNQDCVTKVAKSKNSMMTGISEARVKAAGSSDLYISLSVRAIFSAYKEMLLPTAQLMLAPSGMGPKEIERLFKLFEEMASLDFGFTFNNQNGFSVTMLVAPHKGSDLAKAVEEEKPTKEALLGLLPKEKYLFAMGSQPAKGPNTAKFASEHPVSGVLKGMMAGAQLDEDALTTLDTEFVKLQKSIKHYAVSFTALDGGEEGLLGVAIAAQVEDSGEFIEGCRKLYQAATKVTDDEDFADAIKHVKHKADAETIAGKKVDTIVLDVAKLAEKKDADQEELKHFRIIAGNEFTVRLGAADDHHVVICFGGGAKRYEMLCKGIKNEGGSLSTDAGITAAGKQLPSPRTGEVFLSVDSIIQTVKAAAKAFGEESEIPFDLSGVDRPVAMSTTVEDRAQRFDFMVPMSLIKACKESYDKYAASAKDEDFDEDESAEGEDAKPAAKSKTKAKAEESEEEEEAEEKPAKAPKPAKKEKKSEDEEE